MAHPRLPDTSRFRSLAVPAAGLGLNLCLLAFYYTPGPKSLLGDETYYFALASSIAEGGSGVHHPFWPPLYADAVAALFMLVGPSILAVQLVQIALWLASGLLLARAAATIFDSATVGTASLALFLLHPGLMAFSHYLWPEIPHLFFVASAVWLLACRPDRWWSLMAAGLCLGLALLTKLLLLAFLPVIGTWLLCRGHGSPAARIGRLALVAVPLMLTILPAMHANAVAHGKWMVADSSAFNIWVGLHDVEPRDYENDRAGEEFLAFEASAATFSERQALYWAKIAGFLRERGLLRTLADQASNQYFRLFHAEAFFTSQLPGGARQSYQASQSPLTDTLRGWAYFMHAVVLGAGAFGFCLVRLRPPGWPHLLLAFVGYNLALFLVLHVKSRYLIQLLPVFMIFAGVAAHACVRRLRGDSGELPTGTAVSVPRMAAGAALVMLVEALALF